MSGEKINWGEAIDYIVVEKDIDKDDTKLLLQTKGKNHPAYI